MRIREVITENLDQYLDEVLEDEADGRGDANLLTTLEFLRNRAHDTHIQPRIRVDSLINLVQGAGEQQFNLENLLAAYKNNPNVKNLIKDIKDDLTRFNIELLTIKKNNKVKLFGKFIRLEHFWLGIYLSLILYSLILFSIFVSKSFIKDNKFSNSLSYLLSNCFDRSLQDFIIFCISSLQYS